jgi:hypothetical protein
MQFLRHLGAAVGGLRSKILERIVPQLRVAAYAALTHARTGLLAQTTHTQPTLALGFLHSPQEELLLYRRTTRFDAGPSALQHHLTRARIAVPLACGDHPRMVAGIHQHRQRLAVQTQVLQGTEGGAAVRVSF